MADDDASLFIHMDQRLENMDQILACYQTRDFNDAFTYMLPEEMEDIAKRYNLKILHHLTSDGTTYRQSADFNKASQADFDRYMALHMRLCENKSLLGDGLHGLIFLTK